ncbi:MAG: hypothetical protein ABEJ82_04060 [Haloplanus sp.]
MTPRHTSSLLWGAVGVFAFLVLAQGYRLLVGPLGAGVAVLVAVAVLVVAVTAALTYALTPRVRRNGRT